MYVIFFSLNQIYVNIQTVRFFHFFCECTNLSTGFPSCFEESVVRIYNRGKKALMRQEHFFTYAKFSIKSLTATNQREKNPKFDFLFCYFLFIVRIANIFPGTKFAIFHFIVNFYMCKMLQFLSTLSICIDTHADWNAVKLFIVVVHPYVNCATLWWIDEERRQYVVVKKSSKWKTRVHHHVYKFMWNVHKSCFMMRFNFSLWVYALGSGKALHFVNIRQFTHHR